MSSFRNVYGLRDFEARFGPVVGSGAPTTTAKDLLGDVYRDVADRDERDREPSMGKRDHNRPDLVDAAIRDRFLVYSLDIPEVDTLVLVAQRRAEEQSLGPAETAALLDQLRVDIGSGAIRSIRDVERMVLRKCVEGLTRGRASRSTISAGR